MAKASGKSDAKSWQPMPKKAASQSSFVTRPFPAMQQPQNAARDRGEVKEPQPTAMIDNINRSLAAVSPPAPPPPGLNGGQAKLMIGAAGDPYEQEADRMARQVVTELYAPPPPTAPAGEGTSVRQTPGGVQRQISIRAAGGEGGEVDREWEGELSRARSGGQPLPLTLKEPMERSFGANFGGVRVHTGAQADELARSIQAKAFTTGQDVFFRQGAYQPRSRGGKELLAHELTHVVQQNVGVAQRTLFPPEQLQQHPVTEKVSPFGLSNHNPLLQRRIGIKHNKGKTYTEENEIYMLSVDLHDAVLANESLFLSLENKSISEQVYTVMKQYSVLRTALQTMCVSSTDYGVIDLAEEQHLALFYYHLRRLMVADRRLKGVKKEEKLQESEKQDKELGKKAKDAMSGRENLPAEDKSFPVAILGAGASAAYYLVTAGRSLDPKNTVIIGAKQPWAEERGCEGVINHPFNMIAPEYQGAELFDAQGGLASRKKFSEMVENILKLWPNRKETNIESVEKHNSGKYFTIKTTDGMHYYARRVIVGLGIGKHQVPEKITWSGNGENDANNSVGKGKQVPRMMDMDRFQRTIVAGEFEPDTIKSIAVVGPNAVIDVMSTVLRNYPNMSVNPIYWITGAVTGTGVKSVKRPFFLKGTDNEYVESRFNELVQDENANKEKAGTYSKGVITVVGHDYLSAEVSGDGVTVRYGEREDKRSKKEEKEIDRLTADIVVYGIGPDVKGVAQVVGINNLKEEIEPIYDTGQNFGYTSEIDSKDTLTRYLNTLKIENFENKAAYVEEELLSITRITRGEREQISSLLPTVVGMRKKMKEGDEASMEFIGATAYRFAMVSQVSYDYISKALARMETEELKELNDKIDRLSNSRLSFHRNADTFRNELKYYLWWAKQLALALEKKPDKVKEQENANAMKELQKRVNWMKTWLNFAKTTEEGKEEKTLEQMQGAYALVTTYQAQIEELYKKILGDKYGAQALTHMSDIPRTLPKNVFLGDQLTASRSSVEALQNFVPPTATRGVNFISSNHTVIATHIAAQHPKIPPQLADYITAKIVYERRHLPIEKAPLPRPILEKNRYSDFTLKQQNEFQLTWNNKLVNISNLF